MSNIQLIVGLGNPGTKYQDTRHNAGQWLVETLLKTHQAILRQEKKFHGSVCSINIDEQSAHILIPGTYMNHSGQAVSAIAHFYQIPTNAILVIHDDLDLPVGSIRLKIDGGDGGHKGLRDIIQHLGKRTFLRLRIGIGHPGHQQEVLDYVLKKPSKDEKKQIEAAIEKGINLLPLIMAGETQKVMNELHTG